MWESYARIARRATGCIQWVEADAVKCSLGKSLQERVKLAAVVKVLAMIGETEGEGCK